MARQSKAFKRPLQQLHRESQFQPLSQQQLIESVSCLPVITEPDFQKKHRAVDFSQKKVAEVLEVHQGRGRERKGGLHPQPNQVNPNTYLPFLSKPNPDD